MSFHRFFVFLFFLCSPSDLSQKTSLKARCAALDSKEISAAQMLKSSAQLAVHEIPAAPLLTSLSFRATLIMTRHLVLGFNLPRTRAGSFLCPNVHTLNVADLVASTTGSCAEAPGTFHPFDTRTQVARFYFYGLGVAWAEFVCWTLHRPLSFTHIAFS